MTAGSLRFCVIVLVAAAAFAPANSIAAKHSWVGRDGSTVKADLQSVKDGLVVLRNGMKRHFVPLSQFSLEDRDYIVETFNKRKKPDYVAQLLLASVKNPLGLTAQPAAVQPSVLPEAITRRQQTAAQPQEMYGLSLPSPVMLQLSDSRTWTDLLGRQVEAQFESVTAEGNVVLRSGYIAKNLPLVAFVKSDIEFIHEALKADLEREVFPPGELQPLTPEQTSSGYRVWTDRKGVMLNGKYISRADRVLVLEVAGTNTEFPYHGLSKADQDWIQQEIERRAAAARAAAEAARAKAQAEQQARAATSRSRYGRSGMSPTMPGPRQPRMPSYSPPSYEFHCDECGNSWTNSTMFDHCPNCKDTYRFHCHRCGHNWTRKNQMMDSCPNCSTGGGSSSSSSRYANNSSSNGGGSSSSARSSAYNTGYRVGRVGGLGGLVALIGWGIRWLIRRDD